MSLDKPSLLEETMYNQIEEEEIEEEIEESEEEVIQLNFDTMTATTQEGFLAREVINGETTGTWAPVSQADIQKFLPQPTYKDFLMDTLMETLTRRALNDYVEKLKNVVASIQKTLSDEGFNIGYCMKLESETCKELDKKITEARKAMGYTGIDYDKIPEHAKGHVQEYIQTLILDMVQIRGDIL